MILLRSKMCLDNEIKKMDEFLFQFETWSVARERFLNGEREGENIKYIFCFAPKLSSICFNQ